MFECDLSFEEIWYFIYCTMVYCGGTGPNKRIFCALAAGNFYWRHKRIENKIHLKFRFARIFFSFLIYFQCQYLHDDVGLALPIQIKMCQDKMNKTFQASKPKCSICRKIIFRIFISFIMIGLSWLNLETKLRWNDDEPSWNKTADRMEPTRDTLATKS